MKTQKLIIGITAPQSIILLEEQLKYFVQKGYKVYLMAPKEERTINFCDREGATLLPISINRDINLLMDLYTLFQIIRIFIKIKPDIVNLGTPKVSLLGLIAAKLLTVKKRIYTCRGFRFEHETGAKNDQINSCLREIEIAFKFKKPAIISSHRVNYIGSLDEKNRINSLKQLSELLKKILIKWPEVEFMSSSEMGKVISNPYINNLI